LPVIYSWTNLGIDPKIKTPKKMEKSDRKTKTPKKLDAKPKKQKQSKTGW
jgi:hypothetical protein